MNKIKTELRKYFNMHPRVCSECGGRNLELKMLINQNDTDEIRIVYDDAFCIDCEDNVGSKEVSQYIIDVENEMKEFFDQFPD